MRKRILAVVTAGCMAAVLWGCGQGDGALPGANTGVQEDMTDSSARGEEGQAEVLSGAVETVGHNVVDPAEMFTDRDLAWEYDETKARHIELEEGVNIITEEGVYVLTGSLEEGSIVVDVGKTDKVQLVLAGVTINNSRGAALCVRQGDKVFVTLAEGTVNTLSNGGSYAGEEDAGVDAVLFSRANLTVNGEGSLSIFAEAGHGIVSKDNLRVTGGEMTVNAAGQGLAGKDSVRIAAGTLNVVSGSDGVKSSNVDEEGKGYVYIGGGALTVASSGDCISAAGCLQIDGGDFNLIGGGGNGGAAYSQTQKEDTRQRGRGEAESDGAAQEVQEEVSAKGVKAGGDLVINGGDFQIDTLDDALHSNSGLTVNGGKFTVSTGDDGIHADGTAAVTGGVIEIAVCYEGIEGNDVVISGGNIRLCATDDGVNAAGGRDGSGFVGFGNSEGFRGGADSGSGISISGGQIFIDAEGDGIDSNGSLTVTGGEIVISGPTSSADGALDYEGEARITGGTVIALGGRGMAMNFGSSSTQGSILVNVENGKTGAEIVLTDDKGEQLLSYAAEKAFGSAVLSCPELEEGGTYLLRVDDEERQIVMDGIVYGEGMGGFGGPGGFGGMGMPGRRESSEGTKFPEGADPREGKEFPEGVDPREGKEFPEGTDPREGKEFPEGVDPREGKEFPEGADPREGTEFPEGTDPREGKEFPEGADPREGKEFPEGADPREGAESPAEMKPPV